MYTLHGHKLCVKSTFLESTPKQTLMVEPLFRNGGNLETLLFCYDYPVHGTYLLGIYLPQSKDI
jgi:hypothetical protein